MRVIHSSACMDGLERATGMAHDRFDDGRGWTVGDEWVRGRWAWADPWSRKGKGRHQTGPCTVQLSAPARSAQASIGSESPHGVAQCGDLVVVDGVIHAVVAPVVD